MIFFLILSTGVGVINASAISMGLLSNRGPPGWHPAHNFQKEACAAAAAHCKSQGVDISSKFTILSPGGKLM